MRRGEGRRRDETRREVRVGDETKQKTGGRREEGRQEEKRNRRR